jgi:hypothetical protein
VAGGTKVSGSYFGARLDGSQRDHSGGEDIEHQRVPVWSAAKAWGVLRGCFRFAGFQTRFRPAEGRRDKRDTLCETHSKPYTRDPLFYVCPGLSREAPNGFFGGLQ